MAPPKGHKPYPGCETGGRPCRYSKEDIEKLADDFRIWLKNPENVWFKDFCLDRDINPDLMSEWANESDKFNGVYKLAKHRQESRLINGALTKLYNGSTAEFVLTNHHGYTNKQQIINELSDPVSKILSEIDGNSKDIV